jgi:hypothetical protein
MPATYEPADESSKPFVFSSSIPSFVLTFALSSHLTFNHTHRKYGFTFRELISKYHYDGRREVPSLTSRTPSDDL